MLDGENVSDTIQYWYVSLLQLQVVQRLSVCLSFRNYIFKLVKFKTPSLYSTQLNATKRMWKLFRKGYSQGLNKPYLQSRFQSCLAQ